MTEARLRTCGTSALLVIIDLTHPPAFGHRPSLRDQQPQEKSPGTPPLRGWRQVTSLTWLALLRCRAGRMWNWARQCLTGSGMARLTLARVALLNTLHRELVARRVLW